VGAYSAFVQKNFRSPNNFHSVYFIIQYCEILWRRRLLVTDDEKRFAQIFDFFSAIFITSTIAQNNQSDLSQKEKYD